MWYKSKVGSGNKDGSKIDFPTINLNTKILEKNFEPGVYSCWVKILNNKHKGALYFGPNYVSTKKLVLEIFLLDFSDNIYNQIVEFKINKFIRSPKKISSKTELKSQIEEDIINVEKSFEQN